MASPRRGTGTGPSSSDARKYLVGERIAVGEVTEVFRADLRGTDGFRRPVIIERVRPTFAGDPAFVRRFVHQARVGARLTHANVLQVIDFGHTGGEHFAVLEAVDGPDLAAVVAAARARGEPPLAPPVAVYVVARLLEALDHAHNATDAAGRPLGYVHGDVRPGTVRVTWDGQVKLVVFDSHRAARGLPPACRPPEQLAGAPLDARADVFAAGALLFELLTGRPPFEADSPAALAERMRRAGAPRVGALVAGLPPALDRVLAAALSRDPGRRPPDAATFLQALLAATLPTCGTARAADLAERLARLPIGPATAPDTAESPASIALPAHPVDRPATESRDDGEWSLGSGPVWAAEPAWAGGDPLPVGPAPSARAAARRSPLAVLLATTVALSGAAAGAAWYLRLF